MKLAFWAPLLLSLCAAAGAQTTYSLTPNQYCVTYANCILYTDSGGATQNDDFRVWNSTDFLDVLYPFNQNLPLISCTDVLTNNFQLTGPLQSVPYWFSPARPYVFTETCERSDGSITSFSETGWQYKANTRYGGIRYFVTGGSVTF